MAARLVRIPNYITRVGRRAANTKWYIFGNYQEILPFIYADQTFYISLDDSLYRS